MNTQQSLKKYSCVGRLRISGMAISQIEPHVRSLWYSMVTDAQLPYVE